MIACIFIQYRMKIFSRTHSVPCVLSLNSEFFLIRDKRLQQIYVIKQRKPHLFALKYYFRFRISFPLLFNFPFCSISFFICLVCCHPNLHSSFLLLYFVENYYQKIKGLIPDLKSLHETLKSNYPTSLFLVFIVVQ